MWRSAVQVCLGLHIAAGNVIQAQRCLGLHLTPIDGGLAQLARAPALQAGGQRFESVILHVFVRKRIDAVNPISDTLMMDGVNPALDTVGVPKRKRSLTY